MTGLALAGAGAVPALTWHTAFTRWEFAPVATALLLAAAAAYLAGVRRVRQRHPARPWRSLHTVSFLAGLVTIAVATQSSLGAYDDVLFSVHMVQHLLLIMVAPPLLVAGRPVLLLMHACGNPVHRWTKRVVRSRVVSVLTWPPLAFGIYTTVVVGTHLTSFMNVVLTHPVAHVSEHLLYVLAGYLFFLPLLGSEPIRWRLSHPARVFLLVVAMPVDTFVGVVLTQANHELFPAYAAIHRAWGPGLVADLHAGGAVMWIGGDALMFLFLMVSFVALLGDERAQASAGGWLEAARRNTLHDLEAAARAGAPGSATATPVTAGGRGALRGIDEGDADLRNYNEYLAALARRSARRR